MTVILAYDFIKLACNGVTRGGGGGPPRVTSSRGVIPKGKNLWANLQRIVEK